MKHKPGLFLTFLLVLAFLVSPLSAAAQENDPPGPGVDPQSPLSGPAEGAPQAGGLAPLAIPNQGGFLFALRDDPAGNQIFGFRVDEMTGALTALGPPTGTGGTGTTLTVGERLAYDPVHSRLYAINDGSDTITAYRVNPTNGSLSSLPFNPISLPTGGWTCLAISPDGGVLAAGKIDGNMVSFKIEAAAATAAPGSPTSTGAGVSPFSCAFSRDSAYLYTGGNFGAAFAGFSVDAATGALTALPGSPFPSGANWPSAYALDDAGRLFMGSLSAGELRAFTTAGGVPGAVTGNPFTSGLLSASFGLLHPAGYYLVADRTGSRVGVYRINGSGAATTLAAVGGSPFAAGGVSPHSLALNQTGRFLFASNQVSRNITTFLMDGGTGALTIMNVQPANALGASGFITGLAYAKPAPVSEGGLVYALRDDPAGSQIYGFRVNELSGGLNPLDGFPLATGGTGVGYTTGYMLAYDAASGRLFALNSGDKTVSAYTVDAASGALTPLPFSPISLPVGSWASLCLQPGGGVLIAANLTATVASFKIEADSAPPAPGSPFTTSSNSPAACAFSRDGQYVYTGGNIGAGFDGFSVDAATGALTALPSSPYNTGDAWPAAYASDDSGRLFVGSIGNGNLRVFTTSGGVPTAATGNPFAVGVPSAAFGLLHPAGFYLTADRTNNRVSVARISGSGASTTLAAVPGSPFSTGGIFPQTLAMTASGAFIFTGNGNSRNITTYAFDAATGELAGVGLQPVGQMGSTGLITGLVYARPRAPLAGYLYVHNNRPAINNLIYGYGVDSATGTLALLPGFPVDTGGLGDVSTVAEAAVFDRRNARLYTINGGSDTISAFQVDLANGSLAPLPFSPISLGAGEWNCLAVSPDGRSLAAGGLSGNVASFAITPGSATPAPGSPAVAGADVSPFSCAFSRDGSYFYTGGNLGSSFAGFSVDTATAALTPLPGSPYDSGSLNPIGYAVHADGRLFSANYTGGLRVFTTSGGVPTAAAGNPFASGMNGLVHGLLNPAGFYLAVSQDLGQVGAFRIEGSGADTTLTPAKPPSLTGGDFAHALAQDQSGRLIFAANQRSRSITSFQLDPATGSLNGSSLTPWNATGPTGGLIGLAYAPLSPDLALALSHSDPLPSGGSGSLTLRVSSLGSAVTVASEITVVDVLPAGVDYASFTGPGWACTADEQVVACTHAGPLAGGEALPDLTLNVTLPGTTHGDLTNTAIVSSLDLEFDPANNLATDTAAVAANDLALAMTLDGALRAGQIAIYTLQASNLGAAGTQAAGPLTLVDTLPAETAYTSASGAGWGCAAAGQVVTCTHAGPLAGGGTLPALTLTVSVAEDAAGDLTNTASLSSAAYDSNPANNTAANTATVSLEEIFLPLMRH